MLQCRYDELYTLLSQVYTDHIVMKIGYARVSTQDQSTDLQMDALTVAGCDRIFSETASGAKSDRLELAKALEYARQGDVIVVWKLDRLQGQ